MLNVILLICPFKSSIRSGLSNLNTSFPGRPPSWAQIKHGGRPFLFTRPNKLPDSPRQRQWAHRMTLVFLSHCSRWDPHVGQNGKMSEYGLPGGHGGEHREPLTLCPPLNGRWIFSHVENSLFELACPVRNFNAGKDFAHSSTSSLHSIYIPFPSIALFPSIIIIIFLKSSSI